MEELLARLKDPDPARRREAAESLGALGERKAMSHLVGALRDQDRGVRDAAAEALVRLGGEDVAMEVVGLLGDEDIEVRNLAIDVLVNLGRAALRPVVGELGNSDPDVRKFAADILGWLGEPEATDPLIDALEDPNPNVVCAAVEALGHIGDPRAVEPLKQVCKRLDDARPLVVEALGEIGTPEAMDVLLEAVGRKDDPSVALAAVEALGKVGDERALKALFEKVKGSGYNTFTAPVWATALYNVARRHGMDFWDMVEEHGWEELVRQAVLGDEKEEVVGWVQEGLEGERSGFVVEVLAPIVAKLPSGLKVSWIAAAERNNVTEALEGLESLFSEDPQIAYKAVRAVGRIDGEGALNALLKALKSQDVLVRIAAIQAFGDLGDPKALGVLWPLTEEDNTDIARAARKSVERIRGF